MADNSTPIVLELTPSEPAVTAEVLPAPKDAEDLYLEQNPLSEAEQKMADDFSKKIDLRDSAVVLRYGAACQKKIASFSDSALDGVRTGDLGEAGDMIAELAGELREFTAEEEEKGIFRLFRRAVDPITRMKAKYDGVAENIERITGQLEDHQNRLVTDIVMLDKLYERNLSYFKELSMYILAGKKKLQEERNTTLLELKNKAQQTGLSEDAQAYSDYSALCDRFEKKIHDLELTRTISIQMAPQIRLIQNNSALMSEKIQSAINNTIPLWKNQMVIALGIAHSQQALAAQRRVTDMTNEILRKNADMLKTATAETARESERGIVDIETLKYTNEQLIGTLDEVLNIQSEGRRKRLEAEHELIRIESELKNKLLEMKKNT